MSKKIIFTIFTCILVCMMGCGNKYDGGNQNDSRSESTNSDITKAVKDVSKLPDIVFINTITYAETSNEEEPQLGITFYDKNGNHYVSTDAYVCSLDFQQLVQEYAAGKLSEKISYHTSCDIEELVENHDKLCKLSEDGVEIVYPESGPDVLANYEVWYGLYYDQSGNIQALKIHEKDGHGDHYADDEQVNEIYEWYLDTFKTNG